MSEPRKKLKGISFGTVFMLLITAAVVAGLAYVLPRLQAGATIDTEKLSAALQVEGLPELSLSDIPIVSQVTVTSPVDDAPAATAAPTATPVPEYSFTATFGGSIKLEDTVRKSAYYSDSSAYDFTEFFPLLKSDLQADLSFVTLENSLYDEVKKYSDTNAPTVAAAMLPNAGINVAAVGFPGIYDQGMAGLESTLGALQSGGTVTAGAYTSVEDASKGVTLNLNGIRVTLLHYTEALTSSGKKKIKSENSGWAVPIIDASVIEGNIAQARSDGAQLIIVSLNWDATGKATPTENQIEVCRRLADAGADIIIGSGTDVVQPVVWIKRAGGGRTLCAYSLGTLLSDSRKAQQIAGMLLHVTVTVTGDDVSYSVVTYTPTYIWRYKQDSKYQFRVVPTNVDAPDGMGKDSKAEMTQALETVQQSLGEDTVLRMRKKN